jgi:TolB protein
MIDLFFLMALYLAIPRCPAAEVQAAVAGEPQMQVLESSLEIMDLQAGRRRVVYRSLKNFEAPNWSRDGRSLIFNSQGRLYTIPVDGGDPALLDTGSATNCNNDHGLSPDGKWLAISHSPARASLIYILPSSGGTPRQLTSVGEFDIYTIPAEGGDETRLTTAPGLDDGPDYAPDGKFIYFNSERTGYMRIWRMKPDGSEQQQVTFDEAYGDWFPHPSPNGKWLVFLSYDKSVKGHPANKDVALRIISLPDERPKVLTTLFGGQGTINVPSWSPDSSQFAFVSYRYVTR